MFLLFAGFVCEKADYPLTLVARFVFWSIAFSVVWFLITQHKAKKLRMLVAVPLVAMLPIIWVIISVVVIPWGCSTNPLDFKRTTNPNEDAANFQSI